MRTPLAMPFLTMLLALVVPLAAPLTAAEPITITAITGLQYDLKRFAVEPGAKVEIELVNDDTTDMPHNLVITKPGKRMDVVNLALAQGPDAVKNGFIPKSADIIAAIPEVKPHETGKLSFTAPTEKGVYPYVCTYPGHGLIMFGDMYVGVPLPAEKPETASKEAGNPHAFPLIRPYLYRLFMPESNPASVAVMLPGELNLCFDADGCRPRYLWRGAGVDISAYWKGNGAGRVKLIGDKVWSAGDGQPLRFSKGKPPATAFKGYALVQGYPEFHYTLDGVTVKELVKEHEDGKGVLLSFSVESDKPLFYVIDATQTALFSSSAGAFSDGTLTIPAGKGHSFTITLVPTATKENK